MLTQLSVTEQYKGKLAEVSTLLGASGWTSKENRQFVYFINKSFDAPEQGWKIHLSCLAKEIFRLLRIVAEVLKNEPASFKVVANYDDILHFNAGEAGITQIGKIITIYPRDADHAYALGLKLDGLWHSSVAPTPPSDLYFRPGGNVSMRYGAINNTHLVTHSDHVTYPALISPDAELVPDISSLSGEQVSWAPRLPQQLLPNAYLGKELEYLSLIESGRYQVVYPLIRKTFTVTLLCIDTHDTKAVLVKTYCKRSDEDKNGARFLDKAHNETAIGRIMADAGLGPQIFATYEDDYFYYIVSEYLLGNNYAALEKEDRLRKLPTLLQKVQQMHDLGIVHRDLKLANIMLSDEEIYFIDFELSAVKGADMLYKGGTNNYMPPEGTSVPADPAYDSYSLASCLIHAYTGVDAAALPADPEVRADVAAAYIPAKTHALIKALYDADPEARPGAQQCIPHIVLPERLIPSVTSTDIASANEKIEVLLKHGLLALDKSAERNEEAIDWPSCHDSHNSHLILGLNTGIGGTLLGLLSMIAAEGSLERYRPLVEGAALFIERHKEQSQLPPGLFTGLAGSALALGAAAALYGNERYLDTSCQLLEKAAVQKCAFDLFAGYAGIAYAAIRIYESCRQERFMDIAQSCIAKLLAGAENVNGITAWKVSGNAEKPRYEPGSAHGTAGIALAIGLYGIVRNSQEHLQFAIKCFKELFSHARNEEKGCFTISIGERLLHPAPNTNWCHGTAGILWAMAQLPPAFEVLKEEIEWSIAACSSIAHLSNPTYCHGMAGSLELWRMLNSSSLRSEVTERCFQNTLYELVHISQKHEGLQLFASEHQEIFSPDLWIGWAGSMSALALAKMNATQSILNTKW